MIKIVRIYWSDASIYSRQNDIGWLKENASRAELSTVGHIVKSGRRDIIIAGEWNKDEDSVRDTHVIPRSLISKIEYLWPR